ncbi:hypothetical protein RD792_012974 [Penstemon davidsonii]|uniref:Uncharacterized protein n=1 Tax=Penstemon davidsonii TaxID=160366 RepID=A0ABR0CS64_9LAMI|nr:hypothetical protein RD792_012974 [Penstemon davidsonii]
MGMGVPVLGYLFWTISDNWEWADGYGPKFGWVAVDRSNNLARIPRPLYHLFSKVVKSGKITRLDRLRAWNELQTASKEKKTRPFYRAVNKHGPGCSSIGYGAAVELGPLRVGKMVIFLNSTSTLGIMVGNPETNDYFDYKGLLEYAWSHSVESDQDYSVAKRAQNYGFGRMKRIMGGYDPCYSKYAEEYFNRIDVQKAFHVNSRGLGAWLKKMINSFFLLKFSGDADGRVPVIGSRYCIASQDSMYFLVPQTTSISITIEYVGLTFVTMRWAGHVVPLNKPTPLALLHSYLSGQHLPTTHR